MKLKKEQIKEYRAEQLEKQDGICPLCEVEIEDGVGTLDHDHGEGYIRKVLCRNCNSVEGRVLAWLRRTKTEHSVWLNNLLVYWEEDYSGNPLHPTHKHELEVEISRLRKRMKKVKRAKTKQKYRDKINRLKKLLKKELRR